jgi:hypothetical protein
MVTPTKQAETRDYWSEPDGQIFFTGGKGYGLTPELQTICLGDEKDILKYLETGEMNPDWTPTQRQVLIKVRELRGELSHGAGQPGTGSVERAKPVRFTWHRKKHSRHASSRKRFSFR